MKKKTIFIIIGVIIGLALIIFLLTKIPKRQFNTFEFPDTMIVEDHTNTRMSDTITMVMLNKILGYDTIEIHIYPMPDVFDDDDIEYIAFIAQVPFQQYKYTIFLQPRAGFGKMMGAISHELIHLKQYESGLLQLLPDNSGYIWEGDTVMAGDVDYFDRPYEIEAHNEGQKLQRELKKILYKK